MNGKTCARIRHSIIFNGFRREKERMSKRSHVSVSECVLLKETSPTIRNVTALACEYPSGKEPMRYIVVYEHTQMYV